MPGRILTCLLILASAVSHTQGQSAPVKVHDYTPVFLPCAENGSGSRYIALRSFYLDDVPCSLLVDTKSFRTIIRRRDSLVFGAGTGERSPYLTALKTAASPPYPLQNDGIRRFRSSLPGALLTVDLCPGDKPLDREIFTHTLSVMKETNHPLQVAVALSGLWLESHPEDFSWLRLREKEGALSVTWINHSYSHPRGNKNFPRDLRRGFLLTEGIDIYQEILLTEKRMIESGIIPSVFFRFPGLVSDKKLITALKDLGLIPLGSDAWLGKLQKPRNGSIILVHGNGREEIGIRKYLAFLRGKERMIRRGAWGFLSLTECAESEFSASRTAGRRHSPADGKRR